MPELAGSLRVSRRRGPRRTDLDAIAIRTCTPGAPIMNWDLLKLRIVQPPDRTTRLVLELLEDRRLLSTNVLTYHNNLLRTGANLTETTLTLNNVNSGTFGKLFDYHVDGQVYAEPLYMFNVPMADGAHNVVFVVTEHDSAYAFDANDPTAGPNGDGLLWHTSYIDPANGINTIDAAELGSGTITPELGITDTPVIDPSSRTMYFVAGTEDTSDPNDHIWHEQLHAVDITTGNDVLPPVEIQAASFGTGDGGTIVRFTPRQQLERNGLVLANGVIYTTWSSNSDHLPVHGWLIAYDAQNLQQVAVFNTTPNAQLGTFWSGAPAVDANGNLFAVTGNGRFPQGGDFDPSLGDYPTTVLKLSSARGQLEVADYFTPFNWDALDRLDLDLGSGSVLLLPDQAGPHQHLLVEAGKEGKIYLINRDRMGQFNDGFDDVVQELPGVINFNGVYDSPAFFDAGTPNNRWIYYAGRGDSLKAFQLFDYGLLSTSPTSQSAHIFANRHGAEPSLSANGSTNGIVWAIDPDPSGAVLYAYDATDLTNELYNSNMNAADQLDAGVKFSVPTIADGQVFVGTADTLSVFGLLPGGGPSARRVHAVRLGQAPAAENLQALASTVDGLRIEGGMAPRQLPGAGVALPATGALVGELTTLAWLNLSLAGQNVRTLDANLPIVMPPQAPTSLVDGVDSFFQAMSQADSLA
jgi:hypothetical protein